MNRWEFILRYLKFLPQCLVTMKDIWVVRTPRRTKLCFALKMLATNVTLEIEENKISLNRGSINKTIGYDKRFHCV